LKDHGGHALKKSSAVREGKKHGGYLGKDWEERNRKDGVRERRLNWRLEEELVEGKVEGDEGGVPNDVRELFGYQRLDRKF
jgi:hypothetical protein